MTRIYNWQPFIKIKPGRAYRNMPIEIYHAHPALSNSGLKTLLDCPARYYYKYLSGDYEPKEKPSFKIGKACHCLILEGRKEFEKRYWHNPYSELKKDELVRVLKEIGYDCSISKYLVSDLMEIILREKGIEPKEIHLNKNELNQVISISRAINNNSLAKNAFKQKGESEISLFWQDKRTGVMLKCRPDWLPKDKKNVPDYKTSSSVNPIVFYNDFIKYGYHIQAAFYKEGIKAVFGEDVDNFFFVAQEKEEPFISGVFLPDNTLIDYGAKAMMNGIDKFLECEQTGIWDTYSNKVVELSTGIKPDDLETRYDKQNAICYAPNYLDSLLASYEV